MNKVLLCIVMAPQVFAIIVKDPPIRGYKYSYEIEDPTTGDSKSQQEIRRGDVVTGSYSLINPDGTKRTVKYTADPKSGFQAVVHTEPIISKFGNVNQYYDNEGANIEFDRSDLKTVEYVRNKNDIMLYTMAVPSPLSAMKYESYPQTEEKDRKQYVTVLFTPNDIVQAYNSYIRKEHSTLFEPNYSQT